ncbi:MAG: DUF418 domain-containing protein [Fimbriimonas sp.]
MVSPTLRNRVASLDFLRGVAILGILLANIPAFASSSLTQIDYFFDGSISKLNQWVNALTLTFVTGKFRSMLAILFGLGVALQFNRRSQIPGAWPGGYLKRSAFLGLIGAIHAIFIWHGDILFIYSGIAITTCLLVGQPDKVLKGIIWGGGILSFLSAAIFFAASFFVTNKQINQFMVEADLDRSSTAQIYSSGTYLQQVVDRLSHDFVALVGGVVVFIPFAIPLFLLGVLWARSGVLREPSAHHITRNWALGIGLGLGLPLNALAIILMNSKVSGLASLAWELFFGPLMAPGYLMLGAVLVEKGVFKGLVSSISNVGKVAMTCYLMQSVICTTIFYSWGFRLYGKLDSSQMLIVVAGVWIVNIVFAHYWLKTYAMGPVEWLWRSLTEGRRLPIRIRDWDSKPTFSV